MNYRTLELFHRERWTFRLAAFFAGEVIGWLFYDSLIIGAAVGIILLQLESPYRKSLIEKRKRRLRMQFKDLLYSMSTAVSMGRSIGQALAESIEFWQGTYDENDYIIRELRAMVKKMKESNLSEIEVLEDFAERSGLEDAEDLVMICETCKTTGGDLATALCKGADIIGDKIALERELQTITAQKKFEGRIVSLSPLVSLLLIRLLSPTYLTPLFVTGTGRMAATVSLALIMAGVMAIERVNDIEI